MLSISSILSTDVDRTSLISDVDLVLFCFVFVSFWVFFLTFNRSKMLKRLRCLCSPVKLYLYFSKCGLLSRQDNQLLDLAVI